MTTFVAEATMANGRTVGSLRFVYYSATDWTALWQWRNGVDHLLAFHEGSPEPYALPGRNTYAMPGDQDVISYRENGCACGHKYKRYVPPDPRAPDNHAVREHAR
jgi:hypothetical protein